MNRDQAVVLDACVLANFSLCDTLLRLAEAPSIYRPKWSDEIIAETLRTLQSKLGWSEKLAAYFQAELRSHFGDAWIHGYEFLIPKMTNESKDRHVVAAAAHGACPLIVTFNLRDFRSPHLESWGLVAIHPEDFLLELFRADPRLIRSKLEEQALDRGRELDQLLKTLAKTVPGFTAAVVNAW